MDLYGDLPPTNDGSEAFVSGPQIQVNISDTQKKRIQQQREAENKLKIKKQAQDDSNATTKSGEKEKVDASSLQFAPISLMFKPKQLSKKPVQGLIQSRNVPNPQIQANAQDNINNNSNKSANSDMVAGTKSTPKANPKKPETMPESTSVHTPVQVRATATFNIQDIKDEYDPSNPNNYELYLENRLRRKQTESNQRHLEKQMKIQEKKMRELAEARKRDFAQGSFNLGSGSPSRDSEKGIGTGRGRGRAMIKPAWMTQKDGKAETKQIGN